MKTLTFEFKNVRRYMSSEDDPIIKGSTQYVSFLVESKHLPANLLTGANPRNQNINQKIYKSVAQSFLDGTRNGDKTPFHLKNSGLDVLASCFVKKGSDVTVTAKDDQIEGLFNGGHTYKIILTHRPEISHESWVEVKIWTKIPEHFHVPMAQARNRGMQVTEASMLNQDGCFDWIKESLKNSDYLSYIAFVQNEQNKYMDVKDLVGIMAVLDPSAGNDSDDKRRHLANFYKSKNTVINKYKENQEYYEKFKNILKDVLYLRDYIQINSQKLYNEKGGKAGALNIFKDKPTKFMFVNQKSDYKLDDAILYPILSSMRYLIEEDKGGNFKWKTDFPEILRIFNNLGYSFIKKSYDTWKDEGCNVTPVGSNKAHWDNLYRTVETHCLRNNI